MEDEILRINSLLEQLSLISSQSDEMSGEWTSIIKRLSRSTPDEQQVKPQQPAAANNADGSSESWAKLQVSDDVIGTMDYDSYSIKIYGHAKNKDIATKNEDKKYYFEPIGQLNHRSAQSAFNNITKKAEMTFNVNMWSDAVRSKAHRFLSKKLKLDPVNKNLVRVLPLEKVMITSPIILPNIELVQDWFQYKGDRFLTFKYVCDKIIHCDNLAQQMKSNPTQFILKMQFSLSSQKSQTKETKINIESALHGDMMNTLDQKFKDSNEVLLGAAEKKRLIQEMSTNIIISTIDDTDAVPTTDSQKYIYSMLEKLLEFSSASIKKGDEKAWENVLWDNDNYRPDKSTKSLNDLYKKLNTEDQEKLVSTYTNAYKLDGEGSGKSSGIVGKVVGVEARVKLAGDFSRAGTESKDNLEKLFYESKDHVEWDGTKFVPKEMELSRINLAKLRDRQAFQDVNVKVSYTTSMLHIDVEMDLSYDPNTSSQLFELENKVKGI